MNNHNGCKYYHANDDIGLLYIKEVKKMMAEKSNKEIVKNLKASIEYRSKHKMFIEEFLYAVRRYFLEKYDFRVNTVTGVEWFGVEKNIHYYYGGDTIIDTDFEFTSEVLYDFCKEFGCEFEHTSCDGSRYIFTFKDVDMSNGFIIG